MKMVLLMQAVLVLAAAIPATNAMSDGAELDVETEFVEWTAPQPPPAASSVNSPSSTTEDEGAGESGSSGSGEASAGPRSRDEEGRCVTLFLVNGLCKQPNTIWFVFALLVLFVPMAWCHIMALCVNMKYRKLEEYSWKNSLRINVSALRIATGENLAPQLVPPITDEVVPAPADAYDAETNAAFNVTFGVDADVFMRALENVMPTRGLVGDRPYKRPSCTDVLGYRDERPEREWGAARSAPKYFTNEEGHLEAIEIPNGWFTEPINGWGGVCHRGGLCHWIVGTMMIIGWVIPCWGGWVRRRYTNSLRLPRGTKKASQTVEHCPG